MLIAFRIGRTQVDLRRRNIGMSQLLPQGFDVNAVLVPPCSVQNAKRMAGLLRLLDGVADLVRLVDETIDDPVQVLVPPSVSLAMGRSMHHSARCRDTS